MSDIAIEAAELYAEEKGISLCEALEYVTGNGRVKDWYSYIFRRRGEQIGNVYKWI